MKMSPATIFLLFCIFFNDVISKRSDFPNVIPDSVADDISTNDGKIVGGHPADIKDVPWQAYLTIKAADKFYQCGGSIISKNCILTAAHCCYNRDVVYITTGSTDADTDADDYESRSFVWHPKFSVEKRDYDVAVVKLKEDIKIDGTRTKIVELDEICNYIPVGTEIKISGWGRTAEDEGVSRTLKVTEVPVVPHNKCKRIYKTITTRQFCAGTVKGGQDACEGDSGGPAVFANNKLRGLTSYALGCGRPNIPGVYTDICDSEIRDFINKECKLT